MAWILSTPREEGQDFIATYFLTPVSGSFLHIWLSLSFICFHFEISQILCDWSGSRLGPFA